MINKVVLALDQSTQITGFSVFVNGSLTEHGLVKPSGELITRLIKLKNWINSKVEELRIKYDLANIDIALEEIQLQKIPNTSAEANVATFKKLAYTQAIILEYCVENYIPYEIIPSSTWKSNCGIKGKKRAEQKENAQKYVFNEYGISVTQDEADAVCIGKTYVEKFAKMF